MEDKTCPGSHSWQSGQVKNKLWYPRSPILWPLGHWHPGEDPEGQGQAVIRHLKMSFISSSTLWELGDDGHPGRISGLRGEMKTLDRC